VYLDATLSRAYRTTEDNADIFRNIVYFVNTEERHCSVYNLFFVQLVSDNIHYWVLKVHFIQYLVFLMQL
jgi:hypothetical protein